MQGTVENQTSNQEEPPTLEVDDPELAMALQMSMASGEEDKKQEEEKNSEDKET